MTDEKLQVITFKFYGSEQDVEKVLRKMVQITKDLNPDTVELTRR